MEKCCKIAALYISTLRAIAFIHQQNHWLAKGSSFYGNHLLFERLYNSTLKDLDMAAEKFIGLFGEDALEYEVQVQFLTSVLQRYKNFSTSPVEVSVRIEKEFLKLSQQAYEEFEKSNKLSLGLDDMIMAIASNREESIYLLQQVMKKSL